MAGPPRASKSLLQFPAAGIGVPPGRHPFSVPLLAELLAGLDRLCEAVPALDASAAALGRRYWHLLVEVGLGGATATFPMPTRLGRRRSAA